MNPYNCTKPGNLFVGYVRLRQELLNGFRNGNSFAVLGGRRCGKTSLLIQIEKDLKKCGLKPFQPLCLRLSIQMFGTLTPDILFEQIYNLVVREIQAESWRPSEPGKEYQNLLNHLDNANSLLREKYGADWLAILLIDELDAAISSLPDDQFFQNLRNLLMESRFHRHFRVVATGVKDMARLISSGSSPLNNLRNKYLRIFTQKQAKRLVSVGFNDTYDDESLFKVTGKHPFLLQGILEKLWEHKNVWNKNVIRHASIEFLREHKDFHHWLNTFGPVEKAVYHCLAEAPQGTLPIVEIRSKMDAELGAGIDTDIDEAITVLSYHGVINDSDPDEPEIAGTLFLDWYMKKMTSQTRPKAAETGEPKDFRSPTSPGINIQVSPTIMGASIHQGVDPKDVLSLLDIISELKNELSKFSLDERTKMKAKHALDNAMVELKEPKSSGEPNKNRVKSYVEESAGILKSAGGAVESLTSFIHKAQKLGPYLGSAVGWLSAFL